MSFPKAVPRAFGKPLTEVKFFGLLFFLPPSQLPKSITAQAEQRHAAFQWTFSGLLGLIDVPAPILARSWA